MFYVTGDIHGDGRDFLLRMRILDPRPGDVVMCLGDVGLAYGYHENELLRSAMSLSPATILVMRGNHDVRYVRELREGSYLDPRHVGERDWCGLRVLYDERDPNVLYLPDEGGSFVRNGHTCLVLPGAFSVDGEYRRRTGMSFEPDEQLDEDELAFLEGLSATLPVEYVFSHTCPRSWEDDVSYTFFDGLDQDWVDKAMEDAFDDILENVEPTLKGWYFGHYHDDNDCIACGVGHMLFHGVESIPDLA